MLNKGVYLHKLYRYVKHPTDPALLEIRRDERAEADALLGRRVHQAERYGLKPEHRVMTDLEEEIAEIDQRVREMDAE